MSPECGFWKLVAVPFVKSIMNKILELFDQKREMAELVKQNADLRTWNQLLLDGRKRLIFLIGFLIFAFGLTVLEVLPRTINLALYAVSVSAAFLVCCEDFNASVTKITLVARKRLDSIRAAHWRREHQPTPQVVPKTNASKPANIRGFSRAA